MSPLKINNIVDKTEHNNHANSEKTGIILDEPLLSELEGYLLLNGDKQKDDGDDYAEGFRNWFLFLLNTGLVEIPAEKSLLGKGVFESINELVRDIVSNDGYS